MSALSHHTFELSDCNVECRGYKEGSVDNIYMIKVMIMINLT